ncbi:MAG: hypothetical protein DI607_14265 [Sphingomonas hengshuiensis]|nr:MAG: hypothetical protein DI607_14265 [Sphingomonas hengshuiensis]
MTKRPTKKAAPPADAAPAMPPAASTAAPSDGTLPSEGGGDAGGSEVLPFGAAVGVQPAPVLPSTLEELAAATSIERAALDQAVADLGPEIPFMPIGAALELNSLDERIAALSAEDRDLLVMALAKAGHLQRQEIAAGAVMGVQLDPITTPAAEIKVAAGPRQEFEVISAVQLDGGFYDIGDPIFLTRAAHIELKLAGAVSGEWDERDQ